MREFSSQFLDNQLEIDCIAGNDCVHAWLTSKKGCGLPEPDQP